MEDAWERGKYLLSNYLSTLYTNLTMCGSGRESFKIALKFINTLIVWQAAINYLILHKEMWHEAYKKIKRHGRNLND